MSIKDRIRIIVNAINDVKSRIVAAKSLGDELAVKRLSGDLIALEACLVSEAELWLKEAA